MVDSLRYRGDRAAAALEFVLYISYITVRYCTSRAYIAHVITSAGNNRRASRALPSTRSLARGQANSIANRVTAGTGAVAAGAAIAPAIAAGRQP